MKLNFNIVCSSIFLVGCGGSYEATALRSWDLMAQKDTPRALQMYEKNVKRKEDRLLRLMDEGILLRSSGAYEESNQKLFQAAEIIEQNGYLSLGEQGLSLISNEQQTTYQGEDFEKILVHLYLGLNFLSLNQPESALVETRRVNEILYKMINEGKRPYELNPFARYLGGMLFENDKELNDAFIAYNNAYKISPDLMSQFEPLGFDLIRTAKRMGFDEELSDLKKSWGDSLGQRALESIKRREGALTLLLETGKSPMKYSTKEQRYAKDSAGSLVEVAIPIPVYERRNSLIQSARLKIQGQPQREAKSQILYDIEKTAIRFLQDRTGRIIAKAILSAGTKVGVATAIGKATDNKDLGLLAGIALFLISEADTRSWLLLPGKLQVAKVFLPPGKYTAELEYLSAGEQVIETETIPDLEVKAFQSTFIQRRTYR